MYYPCSENKDADQLRGYREADLRLCFRICKKSGFLTSRLIYNAAIVSHCAEGPQGELTVYPVRPCMHPLVHTFNINLAATSGSIATKFYLGAPSGMGVGCNRFWARSFFDRTLFMLAGNNDIHKSLNEFVIQPNPTMDYGVNRKKKRK